MSILYELLIEKQIIHCPCTKLVEVMKITRLVASVENVYVQNNTIYVPVSNTLLSSFVVLVGSGMRVFTKHCLLMDTFPRSVVFKTREIFSKFGNPKPHTSAHLP